MSTESHPAFYHSKKRLWDSQVVPPSSEGETYWQTAVKSCCVGNIDQLWKLWYAVFAVSSSAWLFWLAIRRYLEFKSQAYHPRFGEAWNYDYPMNFQIATLVLVTCLFPLLIYSVFCRVGHSANDGILLGRDCLHLNALISQSPLFRYTSNKSKSEVDGNSCPILGNERIRSHLVKSTASLNEPEFESFIIKEHRLGCGASIKRQLRPFSGLIHLIMIYAFLTPIVVFESEQIKNDAIDPKYTYKSNIDWLLVGFDETSTPDYSAKTRSAIINRATNSKNNHRLKVPLPTGYSSTSLKRDTGFQSSPYPSRPSEISIEFLMFMCAFAFLTVRIAAPFWFTSRTYSILLSVYCALTGAYLILESAAMELMVKVMVAGDRDNSGSKIEIIPESVQLISPMFCVTISFFTLFIVLAGLVSFYSLGEMLFQKTVTNYVSLISSGAFDLNGQKQNLCGSYLQEINSQNSALFSGANCQLSDKINEVSATLIGPRILAVTTKTWWNPITTRRNGVPTQMSVNSDRSGTIRSGRLSNPDQDMGRKSKKLGSIVSLGPTMISTTSFILLLITRGCLFGPMVQCYRFANTKISLGYVICSVIYLVCWLVLWIAVCVKTAWRFRILHVAPSLQALSRQTTPIHRNHVEAIFEGPNSFIPWPMLNNQSFNRTGEVILHPWQPDQAGLMHQRGSLNYGNSPIPYETPRQVLSGDVYLLQNGRESAIDSVYGCVTEDIRCGNGVVHQAPSSGGLIHSGLSKFSDDSGSKICNNPNITLQMSEDQCMSMTKADRINYIYVHPGVKDHRPLPDSNDSHTTGTSPNNGQSYEMNNDSDESQPAFFSVSQIRANLEKNYASKGFPAARVEDPASDGRSQVVRVPSTRRVVPGRVTFKDHSRECSEDETQCGNTGSDIQNGSSDSGVCTNGSGKNAVSSQNFGKIFNSNFNTFNGRNHADNDMQRYNRSISPRGFVGSSNSVLLETDEQLCSQV